MTTNILQDHCMCTNCLRFGWRGIQERGSALISRLDALNVWPKSKNEDGSHEVHSPGAKSGANMIMRLVRLWKFIRLDLKQHFKFHSGVGAHCLNLRLGSLANNKLDSPCSHERAHDNSSPESPVEHPECDSLCHHVHTDGDVETSVQIQHVRTVRERMGIPLDTKVCANYHSRGTYYPGKISAVHQDTYDIVYDDGDEEKGVGPRLVRLVEVNEGTDTESELQLPVGTKVEAQYGSLKLWHLGVITKVNTDGTYQIKYDDNSCKAETETATGAIAKRLHTCKHCNVSYCHKHLPIHIATSEKLGAEHKGIKLNPNRLPPFLYIHTNPNNNPGCMCAYTRVCTCVLRACLALMLYFNV